MKKTIPLFLCALLLAALTGCGGGQQPAKGGDAALSVTATTYPVYCFTTAVTEGAEGVEVSLLVNQQTSCLHDYTLTVNDMKLLEGADVLVMNGVGLEDFLSDALGQLTAQVIDCSQGVDLLPLEDGEGDGHSQSYDPHIWMDPQRAAVMVENIAAQLSQLDSGNAQLYQDNAAQTVEQLTDLYHTWSDIFLPLDGPSLITFHNGFAYLADAFHFDILRSIEEEEGSEISAREMAELTQLIEEYQLPAIFTEVNGSDASAQALARDTGVKVYALSMVMSGDESGILPYLSAIDQNMATIMEGMEVTVS